jgi:hypothetical protein
MQAFFMPMWGALDYLKMLQIVLHHGCRAEIRT